MKTYWRYCEKKLRALDQATNLKELARIPSNRLHKLLGNRKGQHSLTIKNQYRICFYWRNGNAYEVEIVDYH